MFTSFGGDETLHEPNSAISLNGLNNDWFSNPHNDFTTPFFDDFDFSAAPSSTSGIGAFVSNRNHSGMHLTDEEGGICYNQTEHADGTRKRKNDASPEEKRKEEEEEQKKRRKKTVYETLHRQLSELVSAKLLVEVGTYATLLSAPQAEDVLIRKAIVKMFLHYRVRNVIQPSKWREILDDSFILEIPDSSIYRNSSRSSGAYGGSAGIGFGFGGIGPSSGGKRRIVGVSGIIQDVASVTSFLQVINIKALQKHNSMRASQTDEHSPLSARANQLSSLATTSQSVLDDSTPSATPSTVPGMANSTATSNNMNNVSVSNKADMAHTSSPSPTPSSPPPPITLCCRVNASDIVVDGPRLMCHWVFSTCGLAEYAGFDGKECGIDGMLKCNFNDKHKLVSMEITFDVLSFARQLSNLGLRADSQNHSYFNSSADPTRLNVSSLNSSSSSTPNTPSLLSSIKRGSINNSVNNNGCMSVVPPINSRAHRDSMAPLPPLRVTIPPGMRQSITASSNTVHYFANSFASSSSVNNSNSMSSNSSSNPTPPPHYYGKQSSLVESSERNNNFGKNVSTNSVVQGNGGGFNLYASTNQDPGTSYLNQSFPRGNPPLPSSQQNNSSQFDSFFKYLPNNLPPSLRSMNPPLPNNANHHFPVTQYHGKDNNKRENHGNIQTNHGTGFSTSAPIRGMSSSDMKVEGRSTVNQTSSSSSVNRSIIVDKSLSGDSNSPMSSRGGWPVPSLPPSSSSSSSSSSVHMSRSVLATTPTSGGITSSNNNNNNNQQQQQPNHMSMFPYPTHPHQQGMHNTMGMNNSISTPFMNTLGSNGGLLHPPSSLNMMHPNQQPFPQANHHQTLNLPPNIQKLMAQHNGLIPIPILNSMASSLGLNNIGGLLGNHNPHAPFPDQLSSNEIGGGGGGGQDQLPQSSGIVGMVPPSPHTLPHHQPPPPRSYFQHPMKTSTQSSPVTVSNPSSSLPSQQLSQPPKADFG